MGGEFGGCEEKLQGRFLSSLEPEVRIQKLEFGLAFVMKLATHP
jgi:hypothetical protein